MDATPWVPPPPPSSRPGPAWWQRGPVVLAIVVTAFGSGVATGVVAWMVLDDGAPLTAGSDGVPAPSAEQLRDLLEYDGPVVMDDVVPLPGAELTVASDGCGVIRSDMEVEPHGLQWTIMDAEGFSVLERNALGETRYRYFQPGTYEVVLEAWDGRSYAPISNTVTITC